MRGKRFRIWILSPGESVVDEDTGRPVVGEPTRHRPVWGFVGGATATDLMVAGQQGFEADAVARVERSVEVHQGWWLETSAPGYEGRWTVTRVVPVRSGRRLFLSKVGGI